MKILLLTFLFITNAIADKSVCPAAGAYVEREILKAAGDNKNHPNAKWMSLCMNGYVQGICQARNGELKRVLNPNVFKEAQEYCITKLKRIVEEQRKAGLIK